MDKLISVVIPVYNQEKFIDGCIEAVVSQNYKNIEIILIDDGSSDSSGDICESWKGKDSRIIVSHQDNKGLSAARNAGIDLAKGDFISFVDADDCIKKSFLSDLVMAIRLTGADLAFCDIDSSRLGESEKDVSEPVTLSRKECMNILYDPDSREYVEMVVAWNKLYRRELFYEHRFEIGRFHEDEFMINQLIYSIDKAVYVPSKNYIYRDNEDGITGANNVGDIRHLHVADAYIQRIDMALENGDRDFAAITLKRILLKLMVFTKSNNCDLSRLAKEKYAIIFSEYKGLLTRKQFLKYGMFIICPGIYNRVFG